MFAGQLPAQTRVAWKMVCSVVRSCWAIWQLKLFSATHHNWLSRVRIPASGFWVCFGCLWITDWLLLSTSLQTSPLPGGGSGIGNRATMRPCG